MRNYTSHDLLSQFSRQVISKACKYFEDKKQHCTILELKQKCEMIVNLGG